MQGKGVIGTDIINITAIIAPSNRKLFSGKPEASVIENHSKQDWARAKAESTRRQRSTRGLSSTAWRLAKTQRSSARSFIEGMPGRFAAVRAGDEYEYDDADLNEHRPVLRSASPTNRVKP